MYISGSTLLRMFSFFFFFFAGVGVQSKNISKFFLWKEPIEKKPQ